MRVLHYVDEKDLSWAVSWIQLLKALEGLGVENQVLCQGGGSLLQMLKRQGISAHGYRPIAQWSPILARGLKKQIERLAPQIIHTRLSAAAFLGGYWGKRLNVPVLQTIDKFPKAKYHRDGSLLLPCSQAVAEHMAAQGFSLQQMEVVPNGIDAAYYQKDSLAGKNLREKLSIKDGSFLVLGAGRFVDWKGFDDLIDGFVMAAQAPQFARLDPILLLVGGGEDEKRLRGKAAQSAVTERIRFFPFAEDIRPFMWAADVFVQPSWGGEAFGVVLLEAMASSLACIACCNGGMKDIIEEGLSGFFVPVHSSEAIGERLKECAINPELRGHLSEGARKRSLLYDIGSVAATLKRIYRRVLGGQGQQCSAL